ncbi:flavin reductase family protein [Leucobacter celer]|jgi:flavin reductase (DIM6/NTAB) family NADH-FMN oxidoreductase RutF|uniref:flavin reductase family protein n=1 Tax=Leucobacter celer TaxID=668625 RepID=UPI0009FA771C|nr:flavin reductase family protein [Leucobacter celer]
MSPDTSAITRPEQRLDAPAPAEPSAPVLFDEREYRNAMGAFASGITVITTQGATAPVGFTCQSFYSVSIDPPLVSFSIARTSQSLAAVREHRQVVVNFLSAAQQHLSAQFARSGTDKWQGVSWHPSEANGAPTLDGVTGWVAGEIEREIEAGDHLIFLVRVLGISTDPDRAPLLFYRGAYRELEYMI